MNAVTTSPASSTPAAPAGHRLPLAGLIGGAVLVAAVGATAGWLLHGDRAPRADAPVAMAPVTVPDGPVQVQPPLAQPAPVQPAPVQRQATPRPAPTPRAPLAEAPATTPLPTRPVAVCATCGQVESVRTVQQQAPASGIGAVAGGVLGGVLGNQVGKGNGRTAMTVLGAVGGGFAGNEIEKRTRSETTYQVRVRMDDGSLRTVTQKQPPAVGSRVAVENGQLQALGSAGGQTGVLQTGERVSF